MLSLFRTNQISASLLLIFYVVLMRASVLFIPSEWAPSIPGIFADWFYQIAGIQGLTAQLIASGLLFAQAVAINIIVNDHKLNATVNMFPGLFYIFLSSTYPAALQLTPLLLANTFLIIAFSTIITTYKKSACADRLFNIGFWLALATLFYPPYIWFLLAAFAGLNSLRVFRFREQLMVITGFLTPHLLLLVYYFWLDNTSFFIQKQFIEPFAWLAFPKQIHTGTIFTLALAAILILFLILGQNSFLSRKTIDVRKKISALYWMLFAAGLSALFITPYAIDHLLIIAVPAGILMSFAFTQLPNKWAEALHFLLVLGILMLHYRNILT